MAEQNLIADRAVGALWGLALGDALGMPTQSLSPAEITVQYGQITALLAANEMQPIAPNMPAGSVTDDTEQALLLAKHAVRNGGVINPAEFAAELASWEERMVARGSQDLLGPSTKAAIAAIAAGTPYSETGKHGATNGAAMRIAPLGIAFPVGTELQTAVREASIATHNTGLGMGAALAVATAVSCAVDGADVGEALFAAAQAAAAEQQTGNWIAGASIASKFMTLAPLAASLEEAMFVSFLRDIVGTSVAAQESVVAALLIVQRFSDNPFAGLCCAANLGGDTDTIAAIAGAILGALHGTEAWDAGSIELLTRVNPAETLVATIPELAAQLLELRHPAAN